MNKRKTFCLLAPCLEDGHFKKDACLIPYIMQKYYGYRSLIVTNKVNDVPPVFPSKALYSQQIDFDYITPSFDCTSENAASVYGANLASCADDLEAYILKNAEEIDVLFLFGFYKLYFKAVEAYKKKNPDGIVYLKLDANRYWVDSMPLDTPFCSFLKNCDIITSESMLEYLNLKWPVAVHSIPNGYYDFGLERGMPRPVIHYKKKQNIIFAAGRLGTPPKATDVLLEAFRLAADKIPLWQLVLAGTVEPAFLPYIAKFMNENPSLRGRIHFTGYIENPMELDRWYRKAKVFAFPSRTEGFATVLTEAKAHGCYMVASDIDSNRDAVSSPELRGKILDSDYKLNNKTGKYGSLFQVDNASEMAQRLLDACNNDALLEHTCLTTQQDVACHYDWIDLCGKIESMIRLIKYKKE